MRNHAPSPSHHRPSRLPWLAVGVAIVLPTVASATWPEDVMLSGLSEHDGALQLDTAALNTAYITVIRELGSAVANKPYHPAETLGASGFEFAIDTTLGFNDNTRQNGDVAAWERVHENESPGPNLIVPAFTARKGLPFSLEVGASMGWHAMSRQGMFSGFTRFAPLEGFKPWPDISIHLGYAGYVGNNELELGVFDFGVTIGSTFAVGPSKAVRSTQVAPWIDLSGLRVTAKPIFDTETMASLGVVEYKGSYPDDEARIQPAMTMFRMVGGIQVINGSFLFRVAGGWTVNGLPQVSVGIGFNY